MTTTSKSTLYLIPKSQPISNLSQSEINQRAKHIVNAKAIDTTKLAKNYTIDLRYMQIPSNVMAKLTIKDAESGSVMVEGAKFLSYQSNQSSYE